MAVEVSVLELDTGAPRSLGDEAHLDLAGLVEIGLDLPLGTDVPAEHDAVWRLDGEHARPVTFAAINSAIVDASADTRFQYGLFDLDGEHVVLAGLDAVELLGEDAERELDWCVDDDRGPHRRIGNLGAHESSYGGCSMTASND
jgi:hypothetical protein